MGSKSGIRIVSFFCYFMLLMNLSLASDAANNTCSNGSMAECNEEDEMLMESETSRRFLEHVKYISPGALRRDKPVCNGGGSGEAYSKSGGCIPPPSNPPSRGCYKYYRCRSDS